MSEPVASTLVEVVPAPQNQPPPAASPAPKSESVSAPQPGGMPGVPMAVAAANALGTAGAGAASLGGPAAALAAVGAVAGAAAIGGLARRMRNRRTSFPRTTARTAAGLRSAATGGGGLFSPPAHRSTGWTPGTNHSTPQGRYGRTGSLGAAPGTVPGPARHPHGATAPLDHPAHRKGQLHVSRSAGTMPPAAHRGTTDHPAPDVPGQAGSPSRGDRLGGPRHRPAAAAAHTLAKAASRLPGGDHWSGGERAERRAARQNQRLERVAERTARRVAKGRMAGIDPVTGAAARAAGGSDGRITPVQTKALRRSAMRHRARMGGAVLATALVGLGSALVGNWRHKGKVSGHMRRVWQRMSERARAVREARDAAILGRPDPTTCPEAAGPAGVPVPAETVNIPGRPTPTPAGADGTAAFEPFGHPSRPDTTPVTEPITLGKPTAKENAPVTTPAGTTPTFSLTSAADVLLQAATTFDPENMVQFGAFADELPIAYGTIQEVLRVLTEKGIEQLPLDKVVVEEIAQGYRAMGNVVNALQEVGPTFRKAHAEDLERHENPRNGLEAERKWNV
ncbi:hypothetical protein ACFWXO_42995 [Kitasatospora sp. NPDC059088]|uniref:hypothetical protein n=1 Tax=Kitasatospora sp. NPDC059088 TaxID=3346722 RepID=UPI0036952F0E